MRSITKLFSVFFLLLSTQSILPITIHASIWSKQLDNGLKQFVFLFGDRHLWLNVEPAQNQQKIIQITEKEKDAILNYAQSLDALVMVEDINNYEPVGPLSALRKKIYSLMFDNNSCCSHIVGLTKLCKEKNIPCKNVETRQDIFLTSTLLSKLSIGLQLYIDTYITSWLLKKFLLGDNRFHNHLAKYWGKYLCVSLLPIAAITPSLYAAYKQFNIDNDKMNGSQTTKEHLELVKKGYKILFNPLVNPELYIAGWQVDANILSTLHENTQTKNIIICAGVLHIKDTEQYLKENGYVQEALQEDAIAKTTNWRSVDIENSINIEQFFKNHSVLMGQ